MSVYKIQSTGFSGAMTLHLPQETPVPSASYSLTQNGSAQQASNISSGYMLGQSIAETAQFIVMGCPYYNHSGKTAAGAVILFEKVGANIVERQVFISKYPQDNGHFGWSVALTDSILAVGAPHEGNGCGAVYTWWLNPATLTWVENYFVPYDTDNSVDIPDAALETSGNFGYSVQVSNDILVVGAPEAFGVGGGTRFGAAYVYKWHMYSRRWEFKNKLLASNPQDAVKFGFAVSLDSDLGIAVSAPEENVGSDNMAGAVYIYYPSNESWTETARLTSTNTEQNGLFGFSLDFQAGRLLIGSPGSSGGAAYYWFGYWDNWTQCSVLKASNSSNSVPHELVDPAVTSNDNQGYSVSQDTFNGILYVGNPNHDNGKGCVYAYEISHGEVVPAITSKIQPTGILVGDNFGKCVYGSPDRLTASSPNKAGNSGFWYTFKKS